MKQPVVGPKQKIVFVGAEADAELATLGLSREEIVEVVLAGEAARDATTPHHPANAPGFLAFAERTKGLRDRVVPRGWTCDNDRGLPLTVSPCGRFAIATQIGDEETGLETGHPSTKYPKGAATIDAVEQNGQMELVFDAVPMPPPPANDDGEEPRLTYFLLVRRAEERVYIELSLPDGVNKAGYVSSWARRLVIGEVKLGPGPVEGSGEPDSGIDPQYHVEVRRR